MGAGEARVEHFGEKGGFFFNTLAAKPHKRAELERQRSGFGRNYNLDERRDQAQFLPNILSHFG